LKVEKRSRLESRAVTKLWRALLTGGLVFLAMVGAGAVTPAPPPGPAHFTLVPLAEGAWAAVAKPGDPASLGNAGFVIGSDGVLVVDAFATREAAEELSAEIHRRTEAPIRWVVNTHYHLDHVGGDNVFAKQGAVILADENVRAWVRTENLKWRAEIKPEDKAMLAALPLPDVVYRDGLALWLGGRKVEVLTRPGHTGGDSVVFFPAGNVVFAGDLVWKNTVPNLVDANTRDWIATLEGFLADHPASRFVPGHGEVGAALDVRYFRDYLVGLRTTVERGMAGGKSGPALVEFVLPLLRRRFASWTWFDQFAGKNIEQTEQEINGTKKFAPTPAP
jgi:glyoxylase-like metal-dependent hydrolase (beta-lactamase superfamily II)